MEDRSYIPYYYGLNYEAPPGSSDQGAFPFRGLGLLAGRAMRQGVVGGADAGLWLERLAGVPLEPERMMIGWGGEPRQSYDEFDLKGMRTGAWRKEEEVGPNRGFPYEPVSGFGPLREDWQNAPMEFINLWKGRLLGGAERTGERILGERHRVIDESSMADILDALGVYAGPSLLGKPSLTGLQMFGGVGARGANKRALELAEYGWKHGLDADTVRETTGWFKGMEGKPRFEISDKGMKFRVAEDISGPTPYQDRLGNIIEHEELFKQYPEWKNVLADIIIDPKSPEKSGSFGPMNPFNEKSPYGIRVLARSQDEALDTISHEIQHWIQQKEGFARGSSPDIEFNEAYQQALMDPLNKYSSNLALSEKASKVAHNRYENQAGEIEARDVSGRRTWDADMRREVPPTLRQDAIIRMEGGGSQASTGIAPKGKDTLFLWEPLNEAQLAKINQTSARLLRDAGVDLSNIRSVRPKDPKSSALLDLYIQTSKEFGSEMTGEEFYRQIKYAFGNDKDTLRFLDAAGFTDIKAESKREYIRKTLKDMEVDEIEKQLLR